MIDLRSDTVTRPTPSMREAMASAEVGDDTLDGDPTTRRLEDRVAELLGKEFALFFPSGIMANETAILALTEPGTEIVAEATAHIVDWEEVAAAQFGGVQIRTVATSGALMDAAAVRAAIRPENPYGVRTSLVCLENTHNAAGGRVLPRDELLRIREVTEERGVPLHLDGARLWNAAVASGVPARVFAEAVDTVMVTLSKGLGCPAGSLLAGPAGLRERVRRIRRRLGGGMRQNGVLAAAGLHALDRHLERLPEDHRRAARLAAEVAEIPGVGVVPPESNIVMIDLPEPGPDAAATLEALREHGVLLTPFGPRRLRAVTHLDVDDAGISTAASALASVLAYVG